jgi:hypothetical protein
MVSFYEEEVPKKCSYRERLGGGIARTGESQGERPRRNQTLCIHQLSLTMTRTSQKST